MFVLHLILFLLIIGLLATGPIAFIISLILIRRNRELTEQLRILESRPDSRPSPQHTVSIEQPVAPASPEPEPTQPIESFVPAEPVSIVPDEPQQPASPVESLMPPIPASVPIMSEPVKFTQPDSSPKPTEPDMLLEQKIGTQWILIAGIITVLVGVSLFLKYAYDNFMLSHLTRVLIVTASGAAALILGEVTRRRNYEIVAKGVTALGFALLYASVFAAYQLYGLLEILPAFLLASAITAAAMIYAAVLDEVIIAFISLLGGFGTPILVLKTFDNPTQIFIYIIILSIGAMAIASYRKWRSINILTFIGTYIIFGMWIGRFIASSGIFIYPSARRTAILWLSIFFTIYLIMPIIYELIKKVKSQAEDVILVLVNSIAAFFVLYLLFQNDFRNPLAVSSIILAAANLLMALIVTLRNKHDLNLRIVLTAIGIFFITIAIPLHFKANFLSIAWIAEGLFLAVIGLRYRSVRTQAVSIIPMLLCLGNLICHLPMHEHAFKLFINPNFGLWILVSFSFLAYHLIFRLLKSFDAPTNLTISVVTYVTFGIVLFAALTMEWFYHCDLNVLGDNIGFQYFAFGLVVLAIIEMLFFTIQPLSPSSQTCSVFTFIAAIQGTVAAVWVLTKYYGRFMIFANLNFFVSFAFILGLLAVAGLLKLYRDKEQSKFNLHSLPQTFVIWAVILLLVMITEQIWFYCDEMLVAGDILAHMWISIAWAIYGCVIMVIGFTTAARSLRYLSLCLFALLLAKVFIIDTSHIQSIYRITAFLATGVTLVGVSYLYQHLKKKGFFDKLLSETSR